MCSKIDFYTELICGKLSETRFIHSIRTAEMCRDLAEKHGFEPDKAYMTGILHDICKEEQDAELERLANLYDLDPVEKTARKLRHAPAGAAYVREVLGIEDEDMLTAIRFHTIGRAQMSVLEKILYLGDLVERDRVYPDVEKYREYAIRDLDNGMYEALKWAIEDCLIKKQRIPRYTLEAYNYYINERLKYG